MKRILTYVTLVLLLSIQTAAGRYIKIFDVVPNLALTFTIIYSLTNSMSRSASLGLLCGLLFDSCRVGAFGLGGLIVMYMAIAASYFSRKFYYENKVATILGVFIYTVVCKSAFLLLTSVMFSQTPFFYTFARYILVEAILGCVIAVPLLQLVKWLNNEYIRGI